MDKGGLEGERGNANLALLWMAQALKLAPEEAGDWQAVLRLNLGAWSGRVNPILPHQGQVRTVAFTPDG